MLIAIAIILVLTFYFIFFNQRSISISKNDSQIKDLLNTSSDIDEAIFKFEADNDTGHITFNNNSYQADFILECSYNGSEIYYFGVGCCDRVTHIYDKSLTLLGESGGFFAHISGNFINITDRMSNCNILWFMKDERNKSLQLANSVINKTNSN